MNINGSGPLPDSDLLNIADTAYLEAEITQLTTLLSQDSLNSEDDANVVELLQRLEKADGVAQGVEDKLDNILGKLDGLISSLESKNDAVDDFVKQPPDHEQPLSKETATKST